MSGALTHTFNMSLTVTSQAVAPFALSVDAGGNQPDETVVVAPTWRNTGTGPINLTGVTSSFAGPTTAAYLNPDDSASYGIIGVAAQGSCSTSADCYSVRVTAPTRPATHWDATILETVTPTAATMNWTLHIGDSFTDTYCPSSATREQMAVFVLRTLDPALDPPVCGAPVFGDVPASSPFCRWIEELVRRGVVTGCGGRNYCPTAAVSREQMSVFLALTFSLTLYGL